MRPLAPITTVPCGISAPLTVTIFALRIAYVPRAPGNGLNEPSCAPAVENAVAASTVTGNRNLFMVVILTAGSRAAADRHVLDGFRRRARARPAAAPSWPDSRDLADGRRTP